MWNQMFIVGSIHYKVCIKRFIVWDWDSMHLNVWIASNIQVSKCVRTPSTRASAQTYKSYKRLSHNYLFELLKIRIHSTSHLGFFNHVIAYLCFVIIKNMKNVRFIIPIQQLHNNPSCEGGPHTMGLTLMWGVAVQLLW
jgi:hypothetical protein